MITHQSYVDVLLPLPLDRPTYTYLWEDDRPWSSAELIGRLALVPFGRGRTLTGIVVRCHDFYPPSLDIRYKRVLHLFPYEPIPQTVLRTWQWAAEYYMCSAGDILRAAVPIAFRPDGEQKYAFVAPEDFEDEEVALFADRHPSFTMRQLRTDFPHRYIALLMSWIENDQVYIDEEISIGARPGTRRGWGVDPLFVKNTERQEHLRTLMRRSRGVLSAMDRILQLCEKSAPDSVPCSLSQPLTLSALSELLGVGASVVAKLRSIGVIIPVEVEDCPGSRQITKADLPPLPPQYNEILPPLEGHTIHLCHAPESCPDERLPVAYIHRLLSEGEQVLLLCPSIAVLDLLRPLLTKVYGVLLREYHTDVPQVQRRHVWLDALRGMVGLYVGLRGAAWLPMAHLGAVVIQDEEDRGYRQYEPAPRFAASRVAMMLAYYVGVPTVLTSATPAVETMLRTIEGRYALHTLPARERAHIRYTSVNLSEAYDKDKVQARLLTFEMSEAIRDTLSEGGLVLLLYQRRGFAKQLSCNHCHHTPECPQCHASYRYYQDSSRLVCSVCGYHEPLPDLCSSCRVGTYRLVGTGVERLAAAVRRLYAGTDVFIDGDDGAKRLRSGIILTTTYDAPYDLLYRATMIGIVQIELMTSVPDFRANERTYQTLVRCYSSAPYLRRMVVQYLSSTKPNALLAFEQKKYQLMLDHELEERHIILFPPFARQIDIVIQSGTRTAASHFVAELKGALHTALAGISVIGPIPLPPHKKETDIGYRLTLLIPLSYPLTDARHRLTDITSTLLSQYRGPQLYLYYDVDP